MQLKVNREGGREEEHMWHFPPLPRLKMLHIYHFCNPYNNTPREINIISTFQMESMGPQVNY